MTVVELPKHLSYSQVSGYKTCGERFRLERIERVSSIPSWALPGGSAVHSVSEQIDLLDFGALNQPESFAAAFAREIQEQVERTGFDTDKWYVAGRTSKAWPNKEDRAWWEFHGPTFVKAWEVWKDRSGWNVWVTDEDKPAIELALTPTFGGVPVKMFVDRVFVTPAGELVVVDLKTGSRDPSPEQLGLYAAGIEQCLGIRPKWGTYWMARKGGTTEVFDLDEFSTERLDYEFSTARAGMEAGIFLAHPSNLCGSCGVRRACYSYSGASAAEFAPFALSTV